VVRVLELGDGQVRFPIRSSTYTFKVRPVDGAGVTNSQIANVLSIREATVKAHLTRVYQVLGVPDRTSAALRARELGLHPSTSG
jgi:hypothetical protein